MLWYDKSVTHCRWYACVDCGQMTFRRVRADRKRVCLDCGIRRSVEATMRGMAARGRPRGEWVAMMRGEIPAPPFRRPLTYEELVRRIRYRPNGYRLKAEV